MNAKNPVLVGIVVAVIVGAAAFFGGMKYAQMQRGGGRNGGNFTFNGAPGGAGGQRGGGPNGARGAGFRPVIGDIISADDKSITVKLDDGSTKIVILSDTTPINKTDPGSKSDLTVGTKVGVFGTDNNGTVAAQNIQINPQQMRMNNGSPNPSASPK